MSNDNTTLQAAVLRKGSVLYLYNNTDQSISDLAKNGFFSSWSISQNECFTEINSTFHRYNSKKKEKASEQELDAVFNN